MGAEVTSGWAPDPAGQSPHGQAPGSPASDAAVGFAFEEAANWRADLHAVRAWNDEVVDTTVGDHGRFTDPESHRGNGAGAAVEATGRMVEQVPGRRRAPDGGAGPIGAGVVGVRGMALIVAVGSRGRGFSARLLGSTSHALITHSECPVVVVRPHSLLCRVGGRNRTDRPPQIRT